MADPVAGQSSWAGRVLRTAWPACAGWVLLSGLHLALCRALPGTELNDARLPSWAKLALAATELAFLAAGLAALVGLRGLLGLVEKRRPGRSVRIVSGIILGGLIAGSLFFLGASWAVFAATGRFVDQQTIEFTLVNGAMLYQYLSPVQSAGGAALFVAASTVGAASVLWGARLTARIPERFQTKFARVGMVLAVLAVLGALAGHVAHLRATDGVLDLFTRITYPMPKYYESRRDQTTGPLAHAVFSLLQAGDGRALAGPRGSLEISRRPQISLDQALLGVDRGAVKRWNVVVVIIDSTRADHLRAYGASRSVMPNVDALAAEGRSFLDTASQASHTHYATPCPFTSTYPLRSKVTYTYPKDPPFPKVFLWDILKAFGYRTALVSSQDERWGNMSAFFATSGVDAELQPRGENQDDGATVDAAIHWVEENGSPPFLVYLNFQNPHWPYRVPRGWKRRFGADRGIRWNFTQFNPKDKQAILDCYADALAYTDEQLGRFVDFLKRRGVWDQTLLVVTADHGEAFMEHGFAGHASKLYDEVVKVPLVFRGPGVPPGLDRRPAQLIDIAPSLLAILGVPSHPGFQGLNLFAPEFPSVRSRYSVAHTALAMQSSIERGGLKLIRDEEFGLEVLFDLRADPSETVDVSADRRSSAADLSWRLEVWRRAQLEYYGNPARMKTEYPPVVVDR